MPLHDFRCSAGHVTEEFVGHGVDAIDCPVCKADALSAIPKPGFELVPVWLKATKVFLRFPFATVQPDVHYQSPVDGRVINSRAQHLEDMARNNCVAYDPEMKTDYMRRQKEADQYIEQKVDQHFDAEIEAMPTRKRELLEQELRSGADLEFTRGTA